MEKGVGSSLFVNDGSFMEKFKQLQREKEPTQAGAAEESKSGNSSIVLRPNAAISKIVSDSKTIDARKSNSSTSNGKLAFSLKQKSKLAVAPVKLGADEDEDEVDTEKGLSAGPAKRQKLGHPDASEPLSEKGDVAPSPPTDPTVKKVADKLASFVAKNGRQFEHITRQRNPGDTTFKFLFDVGCADYKYYEHRLTEEEKLLAHAKEPQASRTASTSSLPSRTSSSSQRREAQQLSNYQIPASALYEANEDSKPSINSTQVASVAHCGDMRVPTASDPIAMMEFYMKKAAQEERMRGPKESKDEMPPPASLQAPVKKGHHMGDYIPQEELEKFLATCNDAAAQKAAKEAAEKAKIQADNVGHKLLSKMGWKEGNVVIRGMGNVRAGNVSNAEAASTSRLRNQTNFISRQTSSSGLLSKISVMGAENIASRIAEDGSLVNANNGGSRGYVPGYPISPWDDMPLGDNLTGLKRLRDDNSKMTSSLNRSDTLNGELGYRTTGLSHQLSFPMSSLEMDAMEQILQFQDSVPCKIRAKRGCATHPRSIAERVRRTRISERMRKLQELVPNMDKQTNTADMLDLAVEYIKKLQSEAKTLEDSQASCACSSKQQPNPNPAV